MANKKIDFRSRDSSIQLSFGRAKCSSSRLSLWMTCQAIAPPPASIRAYPVVDCCLHMWLAYTTSIKQIGLKPAGWSGNEGKLLGRGNFWSEKQPGLRSLCCLVGNCWWRPIPQCFVCLRKTAKPFRRLKHNWDRQVLNLLRWQMEYPISGQQVISLH